MRCVLVTGLIFATNSNAQTASAPTSSSQERIDNRDAGTSSGQHKPDTKREEEEKKPDDDVGVRWKGYPSLHLGKGTRVDFRARFQFDVQGADSPANDSDEPETDFARRRVAFEGEIKGVVAFEIEHQLEGENPWRDVYANYQQFDFVQVQGGKFKLPFSLDENTGPTESGFRLSLPGGARPGAEQRSRAHGARTDPRPARALRVGRLRSRRPQRSFAESGAGLRRTRGGRAPPRSTVPDVEVGGCRPSAWPRLHIQ